MNTTDTKDMRNNDDIIKDIIDDMGEYKSNGKVRIRIRENLSNYIIHSDGAVTNCKTGNVLNERCTKAGYRTVTLRGDDGIRRTYSVHRLVYESFIGEVPEGMQINHIDEDRTNNTILFDVQGNITYTNLEVVTPRENCNYGSRNLRISANCTGKQKTKN